MSDFDEMTFGYLVDEELIGKTLNWNIGVDVIASFAYLLGR
jgi:hypothetical protein